MSKLTDLIDNHADEAVRKELQELLEAVDTHVQRELERNSTGQPSAYTNGHSQGMEQVMIFVQAYVERQIISHSDWTAEF